jgi:hypothetical protein
MSPARQCLAAAMTVALATTAISAQAAQQQAPAMHVITISSFKVPLGEDRQKVVDYLRKWMVEPARMNPHVLSYRVIQHMYGSDAGDVAIMGAYENWAAVTAPCEPCNAWMQQNLPAEGTPARKAVDDAQALFLKYYSNHSDQVFVSPLDLAKQPKN